MWTYKLKHFTEYVIPSINYKNYKNYKNLIKNNYIKIRRSNSKTWLILTLSTLSRPVSEGSRFMWAYKLKHFTEDAIPSKHKKNT